MQSVDKELIEKFKNGSMEAFEQVVRRYQQYAFRIAYGILGNDRDAEDMVQEAFITVYYKISGLRNPQAFPTWLAKIVTNLCLRTSEKSDKSTILSLESVENTPINSSAANDVYRQSDTRQDVHRAILNLPADYRTVVVLRDLQGYSYDEIAEIIDVPVGTVKSRIHQARTLLAEILRPPGKKGGSKHEM